MVSGHFEFMGAKRHYILWDCFPMRVGDHHREMYACCGRRDDSTYPADRHPRFFRPCGGISSKPGSAGLPFDVNQRVPFPLDWQPPSSQVENVLIFFWCDFF